MTDICSTRSTSPCTVLLLSYCFLLTFAPPNSKSKNTRSSVLAVLFAFANVILSETKDLVTQCVKMARYESFDQPNQNYQLSIIN